jgi:hypothetical protein
MQRSNNTLELPGLVLYHSPIPWTQDTMQRARSVGSAAVISPTQRLGGAVHAHTASQPLAGTPVQCAVTHDQQPKAHDLVLLGKRVAYRLKQGRKATKIYVCGACCKVPGQAPRGAYAAPKLVLFVHSTTSCTRTRHSPAHAGTTQA